MKRFLYATLGGLFVSLFIVLSGSSFASAASIYDEAYFETERIQIKHPDCETIDITKTIGGYFLQSNRDLGHNWYNQQALDRAYNAYENREGWSVNQIIVDEDNMFGAITFHTQETPPNLIWHPSQVDAQQSITLFVGYGRQYTTSGGYNNCDIATWTYGAAFPDTVPVSSADQPTQYIYNYNLNLPEGYEGPIPPDSYTPPGEPYVVDPAYDWNVTADGILNVSIIPESTEHFMTGWAFVAVHETDDDWTNLQPPFYDEGYPPAGWLGREPLNIQLPSDGYYTIVIGHDNQLDSPPWPEREEGYFVLTKYIQIRFKHGVAISGTTLDCGGGICNDFRDSKSPYKYLNALGIPLFGLQEVILAPLAFLSDLQDSLCTPLSLPLPQSMGTITMPCMTPIYRNNFNAILIIYQTILVALFAYYVSIRSFNTIKDVANPRNDQIETVNL